MGINVMIRFILVVTILFLNCIYVSGAEDTGCDQLDIPFVDCGQNQDICSRLVTCIVPHFPQQWDKIEVEFSSGVGIVPVQVVSITTLFIVNQTGTYKITATKGSCVKSNTVELKLPSFTIQQPRCVSDDITITISDNGRFIKENTNITLIDGDGSGSSQIGISQGTLSVSGHAEYDHVIMQVDTKYNNKVYDCKYTFQVLPGNKAIPQLSITRPFCNLPNGKVVVTNYDMFTEITMNYFGKQLSPNKVGEFLSLSIPDNGDFVTISAKQSDCTKANTISFYFAPEIPFIHLESSSISCNNTFVSVVATLVGYTSNNSNIITIGNNSLVIGDPIVIPYDTGSAEAQFNDGICHITQYVNYNQYEMPITYSIDPSNPMSCGSSSIATIHYDGNYNDIKVMSQLYGEIPFNGQHQVALFGNDTMTVTSPCLRGTLFIKATHVEPVFNYYGDVPDCSARVKILLENHHLFENITLGTNGGNLLSPNEDGVIYGLKYGEYTLNYTEKGCTVAKSKLISLMYPETDMSPDYVTFHVTQNGNPYKRTSCTVQDTIQIVPSWKGVNSTTSTTLDFKGDYTTIKVSFDSPQCPSAFFYFDTYEIIQLRLTKLEIVSQPRCNSSYGIVKATTTSASPLTFSSTVNNKMVNVTGNTYYFFAPVGQSYVQINYNNSNCYESLPINLTPTEPEYNGIKYELTKQNAKDCNSISSTVTLLNYNQYLNAYIGDDKSVGDDQGQFKYSPRTSISTYIVYNHQYCGSGEITQIPIETEPTILDYEITKEASCYLTSLGDAIINPLSLKSMDGVDIPIDWSSNKNLMMGLQGSNGTMTIKHGDHCLFYVNVSVPVMSYDKLFKATVFEYPHPSGSSGLIKIEQLYSQVAITNVTTSNGLVDYNNMMVYGFTMTTNNTQLVEITISYNNYCKDVLTINISAPTTTIQPQISRYGQSCDSNLVKIQFTPDTMESYIVFVGNELVNETNGMIILPYAISYSLVYINRVTNIKTNGYLDASKLPPYLEVYPVITIANESCLGSFDGSIIIENINSSQVPQLVDSAGTTLPVNSENNTMVYGDLSQGTYYLTIISTNNMFCIFKQTIEIGSNEPQLHVEYTNVCSGSSKVQLGSAKYYLSPNITYQFVASIDSKPIQDNSTNIIKGLDKGMHLLSVNTTSSKCPRMLSVPFNIGVTTVEYSIHSYHCGSITVELKTSSNDQQFKGRFELYRAGFPNPILTINSNNYQHGFTGISQDGQYYTLSIDTETGCKIPSNVIKVDRCTPPRPTHKPIVSSSTVIIPSSTFISITLFVFVIVFF